MKQMTRRDMFKLTAVAGVPVAVGLSQQQAKPEKPTEFALGQVWERPDGVRGVVKRKHKFPAQSQPCFWIEWVSRDSHASIFDAEHGWYSRWYKLTEISPEWEYSHNIFEREGGQ